MMKFSLCLFVLSSVLAKSTCQAQQYLRRKLLQDDITQAADISLVNFLITLALPKVNDGIKLNAPDPFPANQTGTYHIASKWIPLWCKSASIDLDYSVGEILGLSELYVDSLSTVNINVNHDDSEWSGSFLASIATPGMITADNFQSTLRASCAANGRERTWTVVGGEMVAVSPTLDLQLDISGTLCGPGCLELGNASIPHPLDLSYASIVANVEESPWYVPGLVMERFVGFGSDILRADVMQFVDIQMRPKIEESLLRELPVLQLLR
ncbi:expressed unknown protein [Seminavis robusta]|uniref:Uncharacterized protein n=1 Tax=Seminavis robusta TaxID=568900 RepID=A0A9N8E9V2_9STRA|nr:expressed unknown protein [Seminavis robusta]|eukprot:Sro858_g211850.1 n/a (268) ;mRNA; f:23354-24382